MPQDLPRGSFDGRDPAQAGEGGLVPQPLGIVAGHDQKRRGVVGAYAWQRDQSSGATCATNWSSCASSSAISLRRAASFSFVANLVEGDHVQGVVEPTVAVSLAGKPRDVTDQADDLGREYRPDPEDLRKGSGRSPNLFADADVQVRNHLSATTQARPWPRSPRVAPRRRASTLPTECSPPQLYPILAPQPTRTPDRHAHLPPRRRSSL